MSLVNLLRSIYTRIGELERRVAGQEMRGKVTDVDPEKALVRVEVGKDDDGNPVKSPWVPYKQMAGALKIHSPPSVGQTMAIRSETGDVEQGIAEAFHWSDDNPANSTAGDAHKLTFGNVTIDLTGDSVVLSSGGVSVTIDGSGLHVTGGTIDHDGVTIDKTHTHTMVVPGGGESGPPP